MKIMDILVSDAVVLNLGAGSKREVLAEMASALAFGQSFCVAARPMLGRAPRA